MIYISMILAIVSVTVIYQLKVIADNLCVLNSNMIQLVTGVKI